MVTGEAADSFAVMIFCLAVGLYHFSEQLGLGRVRLLVVVFACAPVCTNALHPLVVAQVYAAVCTLPLIHVLLSRAPEKEIEYNNK